MKKTFNAVSHRDCYVGLISDLDVMDEELTSKSIMMKLRKRIYTNAR